MIKVGIIGGAGYTAGELIRILINHPEATIKYVQSTSQAGKKVYTAHHDLIGSYDDSFVSEVDMDVDVLFLCMGHGKSIEFFQNNQVPQEVKVIDLGNDFRLNANVDDVEGRTFVYGLPELQREKIDFATSIANPGCFATAIQLATLPLVANKCVESNLHIHAITGSTGAGVMPSDTTHFSWRDNNVSIYKAFNHQHLAEITQSLRQLDNDFDQDVNFLPVRGNFSRGIFASMYTYSDLGLDDLYEMFTTYYESHPFTVVTKSPVSMKAVVNTNKCLLQIEKHGSKVLITSVIDNLIKGASGQAVQNMNIMFGLEETQGLLLKGNAF